MNTLFPGPKRFAIVDTETNNPRNWFGSDLDVKAKVVCEPCNNTWMSQIEERHAKPAMTELITGSTDIPISQERAHSIALFAFKTFVICDHMRRNYPMRFFLRDVRYRFKSTLEIPYNVQMWFARFDRRTDGLCTTIYHNLPRPDGLDLYVCTYAIGHFVFQAVAFRKRVSWHVRPHMSAFENLAVAFWPTIPDGFIWPPQIALMDANNLTSFANRWARIDMFKVTGK
jgi:hypothetical protein